jgi:lambda family phage portal protein
MKLTLMDRVISYFDPAAGLRRAQYRGAQEVLVRGYDAAKKYPTSEWTSADQGSANAEIRHALPTLRQKSRDLGRNNPYSVRAVNVIVNNTVGAGIVANIKGRNKTQTKKITDAWKKVSESTLCDLQGIHNFYGLQALALRSVVESGDIVALKDLSPTAPALMLLEGDFIVSRRENFGNYQGIEVDAKGKPTLYHLYKQHPGDFRTTLEEIEVPADKLMHVFRQDRPGQIRGVPWSHAVIETLKDFDDYQYSTLIRQKIAACFGGFIKTSGQDNLLTDSTLKARRQAEMQLTPGMVRYMNPGEEFQAANPPGVDGYGDFTRESLRRVAAGYGISYESITGDYSQVNFSSGRLGQQEFRRNIENWRWHMLIPQFCNPYFEFFLVWAKANGYDTEGVTVEWVPPAHISIDPVKETAADKEAVKAGFKSRSQVIRENGMEPDAVLEEIRTEREEAAAVNVIFDVDFPVPVPAAPASDSQTSDNGQGNDKNESDTQEGKAT